MRQIVQNSEVHMQNINNLLIMLTFTDMLSIQTFSKHINAQINPLDLLKMFLFFSSCLFFFQGFLVNDYKIKLQRKHSIFYYKM